jgi:hypothetical protein
MWNDVDRIHLIQSTEWRWVLLKAIVNFWVHESGFLPDYLINMYLNKKDTAPWS